MCKPSLSFLFLNFVSASSNLVIFTEFIPSSSSFDRVQAKCKQFFSTLE